MVSKSPTNTSRRNKKKASAKPRKSAVTGRSKGGARTRKSGFAEKYAQGLVWIRRVMLPVGIAIIVYVFYHFFISPYAYRWRSWKNCPGEKMYGVCLPGKFDVHGFDISHHQGDIDWEQLRKTQESPCPIRFVFMKASEGGSFSDTTFVRNFSNARKAGFIRGAYHFYNPKTDPERQAEFFIRSVKLESGDLPPVLDIERVGNDEDSLRENLKIWLRQIERHYHVKPILYASYKFKTRYLNDSIFNSYPYWIAHYYADSVEYKGDWKFWQHTDIGRLPGIKEDVDLNVFNGSLDELKQLTIK